MRIIVVGGTGTIGKAVTHELSARHDVISLGYTKGDINVDMLAADSIEAMYKKIGAFDALVSTTGQVHFGALADMTSDKYKIGLESKLMGQVNLVLIGQRFINDKGSFTLTSGILSHDPILYGSSASMVNGALNSFVKAAAIEMPRYLRINVISPTVITESLDDYAPYFRGFESVSAARAALAYTKSVEGLQTGQVYDVY